MLYCQTKAGSFLKVPNKMQMKSNVLSNYIRASFEELTKVTWPTKSQAVKLTIIVLFFCAATAVLIGAIDYGFNFLYNYLLKISA